MYSADLLTLAVSGNCWYNSYLKCTYNCLIRFISGEFGGCSMIFKLYLAATTLNQFWVFAAIWKWALSCTNLSGISEFSEWSISRKGRKCSSIMSTYVSCLTMPSTKTIKLSLLPIKQLQTRADKLLYFCFPCIFFAAYFSNFIW